MLRITCLQDMRRLCWLWRLGSWVVMLKTNIMLSCQNRVECMVMMMLKNITMMDSITIEHHPLCSQTIGMGCNSTSMLSYSAWVPLRRSRRLHSPRIIALTAVVSGVQV